MVHYPRKKILKTNLEWPEEEEEILSDQAVDAIQKFLILDPKQRASFNEMQEIELFKGKYILISRIFFLNILISRTFLFAIF